MMNRIIASAMFFFMLSTGSALAVPETVAVRITDVTPSSFAVAWMTDVAAEPGVEIYTDASALRPITDKIRITPMPGASAEVVAAARQKGIMKVLVSGLSADTTYFVKTVTVDPANPQSVGRSAPIAVRTASMVAPYAVSEDKKLVGFSNDLLSFRVYVSGRGEDARGDLLVMEAHGSAYPISVFVGEGIASPEGVIDLNNLFGEQMTSRDVGGGEKMKLRIYRSGTFSTLLHYRKFPAENNLVDVSEPLKGFFADIDLDADVDRDDFVEFKKQYRTEADDPDYNPDYDFIEDEEGRIDAKDFSRFAREFGRTGVE